MNLISKLKKFGLWNCFKDTDVNSTNYKSKFTEEDIKRTNEVIQKADQTIKIAKDSIQATKEGGAKCKK